MTSDVTQAGSVDVVSPSTTRDGSTSTDGQADAVGPWRSRSRRLVAWCTRHPFLALFLFACLVRFVTAFILSITGLVPEIAPDSKFFIDLGERLSGGPGDKFAGTYWASAVDFSTYLVPVAVLFSIFGTSYALAQMVTVAFGGIAVTASARLAREVVPLRWAIAAGVILALFPSQVVWGSLPIRDAAVWAVVACLALAVAVLLRATTRRNIGLLLLAVAVLFVLLGHIRLYSTAVAALMLFFVAILVRSARDRIAVAVGLVLIVIVLPWVMGFGPLGINLLDNDFAEIRALNAAGAESGFVPYTTESLRRGAFEHLPTGLRYVLLEPFPWSSLAGDTVKVAKFEVPLRWLLLLGTLTAIPLLWRARRVLGFPALYLGGVTIALALAEGNFGTLDRHRGELVWPMTLLSVVIAHAFWTDASRRDRWSRRLRAVKDWVMRRPDLTVGLAAAAVHGAVLVGGGVVRGADSVLYVKIAKSIADGDPNTFGFPMHVGYSIFLAPAKLIGIPMDTWVTVLHVALAAGIAIVVRRVAALFAGRGPALIVGLLAACYPSLLFWTRYLLTDTLFVFAVSLFALVCGHVVVDGTISRRRLANVALTAAFVIFTRPTGLVAVLFGVLVVTYAVVDASSGSRRAWRAVVAGLGVIVILTTLVLTIRPTREAVLGNASVAVSLHHSRRIWTSDINHVLEGQFAITPYARDENWEDLSDESLEWIADHPGEYASRAGLRFGNFWFPWLSAEWSGAHLVEDAIVTLLLYGFAVTALLMARNGVQRRLAAFLGLLSLSQGLLVMVSQIDSEARYRLPAEMLLVPLVAIVLERLSSRRTKGRRADDVPASAGSVEAPTS